MSHLSPPASTESTPVRPATPASTQVSPTRPPGADAVGTSGGTSADAPPNPASDSPGDAPNAPAVTADKLSSGSTSGTTSRTSPVPPAAGPALDDAMDVDTGSETEPEMVEGDDKPTKSKRSKRDRDLYESEIVERWNAEFGDVFAKVKA